LCRRPDRQPREDLATASPVIAPRRLQGGHIMWKPLSIRYANSEPWGKWCLGVAHRPTGEAMLKGTPRWSTENGRVPRKPRRRNSCQVRGHGPNQRRSCEGHALARRTDRPLARCLRQQTWSVRTFPSDRACGRAIVPRLCGRVRSCGRTCRSASHQCVITGCSSKFAASVCASLCAVAVANRARFS